MATIQLIQTGTATIASGSTSGTATLGTTLTDTSKTVLIFGAYENLTTSVLAHGLIAGTITNTTTLTFYRGSSTTVAVTVQWQVIEFSSGVTVQRGNTATLSSATTNVTISSVDTSKAWPTISQICNDSGEDLINQYNTVQAYISSSTNLQLALTTVPVNVVVYWQVVEYDNCTVASYAKTFTETGTSTTQSITSVDVNSTILYNSFNVEDFGEPFSYHSNSWPSLYLTNGTTVTYSRYSTPSEITDAFNRTYVISFSDSVSVQRGQQSCSSTTTTDVSIATIDQTKSFSKMSGISNHLIRAEIAGLQFNIALFGSSFTSATNLRLTRSTGAGPQNALVSWEVLEFVEAAAAKSRTMVIWIPAI